MDGLVLGATTFPPISLPDDQTRAKYPPGKMAVRCQLFDSSSGTGKVANRYADYLAKASWALIPLPRLFAASHSQ